MPAWGMATASLMFNFRADRAREILTALLDPISTASSASGWCKFAAAAGMAEYSAELEPYHHDAVPARRCSRWAWARVSRAGLQQLRIAETEKYAHVTFFFNGGEEALRRRGPHPGALAQGRDL